MTKTSTFNINGLINRVIEVWPSSYKSNKEQIDLYFFTWHTHTYFKENLVLVKKGLRNSVGKKPILKNVLIQGTLGLKLFDGLTGTKIPIESAILKNLSGIQPKVLIAVIHTHLTKASIHSIKSNATWVGEMGGN